MTYLILYLVSVLVTTFWNVGLRIITDKTPDGYEGLLYVFRDSAMRFLPESAHKPLISCVTCMASLWGTIWYSMVITFARVAEPLREDLWGFDSIVIFAVIWPLVMATTAYTGTLLWLILTKLRDG